MAARKVKIRHDAETRAKIQTSQLLNRLADHALGKVELLPTQVRAIEILLRKTLPDLASTEIKLNDHREVAEWSTEELHAFLERSRKGRRARGSEQADGATEPDSVH